MAQGVLIFAVIMAVWWADDRARDFIRAYRERTEAWGPVVVTGSPADLEIGR